MLYEILQDFPGSQDGTVTEQFVKGTQRHLSDWLAPLAVSAGWARLAAPAADDPAAVATAESEAEPSSSTDTDESAAAPRRRGKR